MFMATEIILKKYSYSLLALGATVSLYSAIRIMSCTFYGAGVQTDFCKLSGFIYFNFYGLPILALALIGILLPKLSESEKIQKFTIAFLAITTARFLYLLGASLFS
jgi:hypothetical protein